MNNLFIFSCPKCGKKFSFLSNVYKHQMLVHRASENNELLFNDKGKKNSIFLKHNLVLCVYQVQNPLPAPPFQLNQKIRKAKGSSSYFLDACEEP